MAKARRGSLVHQMAVVDLGEVKAPTRRGSLVQKLRGVLGKQSTITRTKVTKSSSSSSCSSPEVLVTETSYRVVILGQGGVGKTAIVSQFLYDSFPSGYTATVDEMYQGEFTIGGTTITLDIQDTGGAYKDDFPAMLTCSLASASAAILVYSVEDAGTFDEVSRLRDLVHQQRGEELPLVIVGNKTDLVRQIPIEEVEATVLCDWENGFVECSAKDNTNIPAIFRALLVQAKSSLVVQSSTKVPPAAMRRRQSLPQLPAFTLQPSPSPSRSSSPGTGKRRGSLIPMELPFRSASGSNSPRGSGKRRGSIVSLGLGLGPSASGATSPNGSGKRRGSLVSLGLSLGPSASGATSPKGNGKRRGSLVAPGLGLSSSSSGSLKSGKRRGSLLPSDTV